MPDFLEAVTGGAVWGIGFAVALGGVRMVSRGMRPTAKSVIKGAIAAGDWIQRAAGEGREAIEDLYHEARSEMEAPEEAAG